MDHRRLIEVIQKYGVIIAPDGEEFILASGLKSKFYIDFSKIVMTPEGMEAVITALSRELFMSVCTAIGGPSSGADPIIGAFLLHMQTRRCGVRGFTVRKEPKGRGPGAGSMIEGYILPNEPTVIIEDVTTSGQSVLKAIKEAEAAGAKIVSVISLLDRQAGASELLKDYDFRALVRLDQLTVLPII